MKYRKKPIVIEAQQWDGTFQETMRLSEEMKIDTVSKSYNVMDNTVSLWRIGTLEGPHEVSKGDWIIKGIKGELYPCKPDIFEMTYNEEIDPSDFTSLDVSIELHKHGFYVPSSYYYEWTGATEISKSDEKYWFQDSINVYTQEEIDEHFPSNVAVNENVKEFGIKPGDNEVTKKARVLVTLLKNNIISKIDATSN